MIRLRDSRLSKAEAHLEEQERAKGNPGEPKAMPLIWEVLERYPRVKAQAENIKGIRKMEDDEAVSHLLDVLDDNPEAKTACLARIVEEEEKLASSNGITKKRYEAPLNSNHPGPNSQSSPNLTG